MATPEVTSSVTPPPSGWATRLPLDERIFLWLVVSSVIVMTAFVLAWLYLGKQNVPTNTKATSPAAFSAQVSAFVKRYGAADGRVYVPPGTDAYMLASRYSWYPELALQSGARYRIWLSSADSLHGFALVSENINLEVAPHHAMGAWITIGKPGRYLIVCNEYCGLHHQDMRGHIDVLAPAAMHARLQAIARAKTSGSKASAAGAAGAALPLRVVGNTLAFDKKTLSAHAGRVTLTALNPSPIPHNIAIKGHGVSVEGSVVTNGGTSTVSASLKPGTYTFYCAVPGHEAAGMRGTLTVEP
jgi:heme/copper-type cytochrome/quinol oxidase subunit 2